MARGLLADEKTSLEWNAPRILLAKNKVKLILNLCLIAGASIPRGGVISVKLTGEGDTTEIEIEARGAMVRLASHVCALVAGEPESDSVDAHGIQAFYTGLVARESGMDVAIAATPEAAIIKAKPKAAAVADAGSDDTATESSAAA